MRITMHEGTVEDVLPTIAPESQDGMITDPPYGLNRHLTPEEIMAIMRGWLEDLEVKVGGAGFKNRAWDSFVPHPLVWKQCYRALKPGAYGVVFAGQRTLGLVDLALRLAGFEVRDTLMWLYATGSPLKSMAMDLAIDKELGKAGERKVVGQKRTNVGVVGGNYGNGGRSGTINETAPATPEAEAWDEYGTALRPAYEPALLVMKPVAGSYAKNALTYGTGGLNLRGVMPGGGMPPDVLIDEWMAERLGEKAKYFPKASREERDAGCEALEARTFARVNPGGVTADPRWAPTVVRNHHDCVKPIALTEWLSTLILPPAARSAGGPRRALVPYCGVWSEIIGTMLAGWDEATGVEMNRMRATKEMIEAGFDPKALVEAGYPEIGSARAGYWAQERGLTAPTIIRPESGGLVAAEAGGVPGQLPLFQ